MIKNEALKICFLERLLITKPPSVRHVSRQIRIKRSLSKKHCDERKNERKNFALRNVGCGWHPGEVHRVEDDYGKEGRSAARERSRGTMIFDLCASWAAGRKRNYCNQDLFRALYCHNTADLPAVISRSAQARLER